MEHPDPFHNLFNGIVNMSTLGFSVCMPGELTRPRFTIMFPAIPPIGTTILRLEEDPPTGYRIKEVVFLSPFLPDEHLAMMNVPDNARETYKAVTTAGVLIVEELTPDEFAVLRSP